MAYHLGCRTGLNILGQFGSRNSAGSELRTRATEFEGARGMEVLLPA